MFSYVLSIKGQICCMGVLLYIAWTYFTVKRTNTPAHRLFRAMLILCITNVLFDMITVYTINHFQEISPTLNHFLHIIYMASMASAMYVFYLYIRHLAYENPKITIFHRIPLAIAILGSVFLKFECIESPYGNYSWGSYAFVAFGSAYFYFACAGILMLRRGKYMEATSRRAIGISMVFIVTIAIIQGMYPEILMSSLGTMMIVVALFYTLESPDALLIEKLAEERKNAESASRAKSLFLAQMSHEIRTPINAVLGMNEMVLHETDSEDIRDYASTIKESGKTLLAIINSILDFTTIEDGKIKLLPVKYDTAKFINNIVNSVYNRARSKGLYLEIEVDESLPSALVGDDLRLTQVVLNLLTNAIKYTEKGRVSFSILAHTTIGDSVSVRFTVKDTGIGIKESELPDLFNPFQRLDEKRNRHIEGTGLGMAIVHRLLQMMNSSLSVESTYGEGSTFSFEVMQKIADSTPIGDYKDRLLREKEKRDDSVSFMAPDAKVLIVDDNTTNHKVSKHLLKLFRITPDLASSGAEAIEMVKQKTYHIVCLDHMMPELDGIETLDRMRREKVLPDDTVVLAMTANAVAGAKEMYLEKGFDDYISKPIAMEELEEKLLRYLPSRIVTKINTADSNFSFGSDDILEFAPSGETVQITTSEDVEDALAKLKALGIDVKEGLHHCAGDRDFYFEVLRDYSLSEEKRSSLDLFLHLKDLHNYEIAIHAIKSASRTIGALDIATQASGLEEACTRGDEEYIEEHHQAFLTTYAKLSEDIRETVCA